MSLLSESMEAFVILDKTTVPDGYGGYIPAYREGAAIQAAVADMSSVEKLVAQQNQTFAQYKIFTTKALNLQYHDVVRRLRDGKIFRVTSDGDDRYTPASANLDIRTVEAEEWSLPNE